MARCASDPCRCSCPQSEVGTGLLHTWLSKTQDGAPRPPHRGGRYKQLTAHTLVVSPVPHFRGAGFDGGAAARDQYDRCLGWQPRRPIEGERCPPMGSQVHRLRRGVIGYLYLVPGGSGCGF